MECKEGICKITLTEKVGSFGGQFKVHGMVDVVDSGIFDVEFLDAERHRRACVCGWFFGGSGIGHGDIKVGGTAF